MWSSANGITRRDPAARGAAAAHVDDEAGGVLEEEHLVLGDLLEVEHHADHVVTSEDDASRFGVPLLAHALAAEAGVAVDETLADGDVVRSGGLELEVIATFKPELAILDIGLPVMDGYELATKIRDQLDGNTPRMFALTGYGQQADREKSVEAGFTAHFVKPVDVKQLIESISAS